MHTYLIGEIGQNHNGSVETAKRLIDLAATEPTDDLFGTRLRPFDAIKLTKRDLTQEMSSSAWHAPYTSPHSFGKTYGEHRTFLELSEEEHFELFRYAKSRGLDVVETLCGTSCLDMLGLFKPDYLKVASRDLSNLPLLDAMAATGIPLILSTGMSDLLELSQALEVVLTHHDNVTILHCLSQYPAEHQRLNLRTIPYLQRLFPQHRIGYSDHSIGILMPPLAVALGAAMIEKHITLDRRMKGADQQGSLGPDGMRRMVRDVRLAEQALGEEKMEADAASQAASIKLGRSVASKVSIQEGTVITEDMIHLLSPGDGVRWANRSVLIGGIAVEAIAINEIIYPQMIQRNDGQND
ncbi:MAG: N-acetylneuraminate synthase family protein [Saprospiraceae bacterium]|nr:N-acetylneuraminate synthase family protein [Saprospiraceae bacterium]